MTKKVATFAIAVMVTLLTLLALWQFRLVVAYVLISLVLAASLRPLLRGWSRRGLTARLGLLAFYLLSLGAIGYAIYLIGSASFEEIGEFVTTLSIHDAWNFPQWLSGNAFLKTLVAWMPSPNTLFEAVTGDEGQLVLPALFMFTQGTGQFLSGAVIVLLLSIYWSINQGHFERLWLSLLPPDLRKQVRAIWHNIEAALGAYVRSEVIQSLLAIVLFVLGYWLLGLPYPVTLALIAALAWLIPVIGAGLAILPVLLIGFLTSAQLGLVGGLYTLGVLVVLQIWVEPRLLKKKWNNPVLTLTLFLAMFDAMGLYGILVSPPLSIVCQILWHRLVSHRSQLGATEQISDLKLRLANLSETILVMSETPPPLVASSFERLTELLEDAEPVLLEAQSAVAAEPNHPSKPIADPK